MILDEKRISQSVSLSEQTMLPSNFIYDNMEELGSPIVADPDSLPEEVTTIPEKITGPSAKQDPNQFLISKVKVPPTYNPMSESGFFSDDHRRKSFFEKVFGADLNIDLPHGYSSWNPVQRAVFKAYAGLQNITRRVAGRAAHQTAIGPSGRAVDLNDPESMQEFDGLRDSWELGELKKTQARRLLTEDEQFRMDSLKTTALKWYQKGPEAVGLVAQQAFEYLLVKEVMVAAGAGQILTEQGKGFVGRFLPKLLAKSTNPDAVLTQAIVKAVETAPDLIGTFFVTGALTPEEFKEGDSLAGESVKAGTRESMYALPILLLGPTGAIIKKSGATEPLAKIWQGASAKVSGRMLKAKLPFQRKVFVREGIRESEEAYFREFGVRMTDDLVEQTRAVYQEMADQVRLVSGGAGDDVAKGIAKAVDEAKATNDMSGKVGQEKTIPERVRATDAVVEDAIEDVLNMVRERTRFNAVRQADGNYAILDENFHEVAAAIKRKDLSKTLDDVVFGVQEGAKTNRVMLPKKGRKTITIDESAELKRAIRRLNAAGNDGFRAGVADAQEKAAIRLTAANERISTIRLEIKDGVERQIAAKGLVDDFVIGDTAKQKFVLRIIKSRTSGGFDNIIDDVEKVVNAQEMTSSVQGIRDTFKSLSKKYGNKGELFAKAPDNIRPFLQRIYKGVDVSKLKGPTLRMDAAGNVILVEGISDDVAVLAGNMRDVGTNMNLRAGNIVGEDIDASFNIPESLLNALDELSERGVASLTATDVNMINNTAKMIARRAELAHVVRVNGKDILAGEMIDDSLGRIIPKDVPLTKLGKRNRTVKDTFIGVENDNLNTLFTKMFGSDSRMSGLLNELYEGETKAAGVERNAFEMFRSYKAKNNISDKTIHELEKTIKIKFGGEELPITRNELLGIAMFLRDPDNFNQLYKSGGIKIRNKLLSVPSTDELADAISKLTEEELLLGGSWFDLHNKYLGPLANETSIYLNGTKIATDPLNYARHRVSKKATHGFSFAAKTAETHARFMPRTGGRAPIQFRAFTTELMDSVQATAKYNSMSIPLRSMKSILGDGSFQKELIKAGYEKELENSLRIIARSEGMFTDSAALERLGSDVLNKFTTATLALRTSTIGTQVTSVAAAKSMIPRNYFRPTDLPSRSNVKEITARSDFFWHRWDGKRVSIELGDLAAKNSIQRHLIGKAPKSEIPMQGMIWGDQVAINKIYQAARREVAATTSLTGEELTGAAIKRLEDVVRQTQPNWNVLNRSAMSSDPGLFKRMHTIFRSAPEAQLNIAKQANANFARTGNKAELVKSYGAVAESVASLAIWRTLYKTARTGTIAGTAAWIGVHIPERDDPAAMELGGQFGKSALALFPGGSIVGDGIEAGILAAMGEAQWGNRSSDPVSQVIASSVEVAVVAGKYINMGIDASTPMGTNKYGIAVERPELGFTSMDVAKDVAKVLRAASVATGAPGAAAIDEWVWPSLNRSKHDFVRSVQATDANNPVQLQNDMDKFLTRWNELSSKETGMGLSEKEIVEMQRMSTPMMLINSFRELYSDPETRGDDAFVPIELSLNKYYRDK